MNKIKGIILSLVAVGAVLIPLSASAAWYSPIYNLGSNIFSAIESIFQPRVVQILGNTTPIAGTTYTLAGPGLNSTVTSRNLNSFTIPQTGYRIQTSDLGSIVYFTIEPGNSQRQEIVSCTGVTQAGGSSLATLTGCLRGLAPIYPYTASTTYAFTHSAGVAVVISNPPQLFNLYAAKDNNETITGDWKVPAPAGSSSIANKFYADSLSFAGSPPLSETVAGLGIGATQLEMMTGTATSTYGTSTYQNILQAKYANATSSATTTVPITKTNGKLSQGFLDLTQDFTFSGTSTFTGANMNVSSTANFSGKVNLSASTTIPTSTIPRLAFKTVTSTSDFSIGTTTFTNVTGATTTLTTSGNTKVLIIFSGDFSHTTPGSYTSFDVKIDGTVLAGGSYGILRLETSTINYRVNASFSKVTGTLSAGTHTFQLIMATQAATSTLDGNPSNGAAWSFTTMEVYN